VIGVDVTLEEIENILNGYTWGSAYAFLINNEGETIFHPLLRPSTQVCRFIITLQLYKTRTREIGSFMCAQMKSL
jgi:hypothetical protein